MGMEDGGCTVRVTCDRNNQLEDNKSHPDGVEVKPPDSGGETGASDGRLPGVVRHIVSFVTNVIAAGCGALLVYRLDEDVVLLEERSDAALERSRPWPRGVRAQSIRVAYVHLDAVGLR